jgi:hypothetical protein
VERRSFLELGSLLAFAGAVSFEDIVAQSNHHAPAQVTGLEFLGKPYNSQVAQLTYNPAVEAAVPPTPNGLLYYDKVHKKFISPVDISPTIPKGSYSISSTLRTFNLSKANYQTAQNSQQEVQLGLNFTAPLTSSGDNFAWILKNAVNIFLATPSNVSGAYAQFQKDNPLPTTPTAPAAPTNKVQVLQGTFDLQVNAFFQKKQGLWRKLFQAISGIPGSPLIATLGIPGIALEGLSFLTYSINKLTQNEGLIPIWHPQPLPFGLTTGVSRDFGFQEGLWCIIDSSFLKSSNLLSGFTLDIAGETYQVLDSNGKQADANYVVAQFDVKSI